MRARPRTQHDQGLVVAQVFWGLWLLRLGVLVIRSGFAPRQVGILLIPNGIAYVAQTLTSLFLPEYASLVGTVAILPEALGEGSLIVWLLTTNASVQPAGEPAIAGTSQ